MSGGEVKEMDGWWIEVDTEGVLPAQNCISPSGCYSKRMRGLGVSRGRLT